MNTSTLVGQFREAMAGVATPVSIVTTLCDGRPHGSTVSAFLSLSMEPALLLVSLHKQSKLLDLIRTSNRFGLNVLGVGQRDIAAAFAKRADDKFNGVRWQSRQGVPRLYDVSGWVACVVDDVIDAGDHRIIIGNVIEADSADRPPLTYHRRVFGTHTTLTAAS